MFPPPRGLSAFLSLADFFALFSGECKLALCEKSAREYDSMGMLLYQQENFTLSIGADINLRCKEELKKGRKRKKLWSEDQEMLENKKSRQMVCELVLGSRMVIE